MSTYPQFPRRNIRDLSGIWEFAFTDGGRDLEGLHPRSVTFNRRMAVPACFDTCPAYAGKRGTALYRRRVHLRPGRQALLRFHGLGLWARVYVDGEALGECSQPYTPFDILLPARAHELREIVVVVDNRLDPERVPLLPLTGDFYLHGGIFRGVELHELPEFWIDRVLVRVLDADSGLVQCEMHLAGRVPERVGLHVGFDGADPELFPEADVVDHQVLLLHTVPDARLWSPADPQLHTLFVATESDAIVERFGLRRLEWSGGRLHLNGTPLPTLRGINRHEAHSENGVSLSLAQIVQDVQLLKDLGCSLVRGTHYPQDPRFLDLCDEVGILVMEETLSARVSPEQAEGAEFQQALLAQAACMVRRSINHPSVVLWGFMDDGPTDRETLRPLVRSMVNVIREQDLSRPVTYATSRPNADLFLDLVDVISVNLDAGPSDEAGVEGALDSLLSFIRTEGFSNKPLLVSSIGVGAIYGCRDRFHGLWSERYQAEFLERVFRVTLENPRFCGIVLSQFCDVRSGEGVGSLIRPRGFNNQGVLDEYRRPKEAYTVVRSRFRR